MSKIGIGAPSKIWMVNLMVCTWNIQPTNMMNGMNKSILIYKPKKRADPRVQGMVKNQLKIVQVKNNMTLSSQIHSELFNDFGMYQADTGKIIGLYNHSNYG